MTLNDLRTITVSGETYFSPSDYNALVPEEQRWGYDAATKTLQQHLADGTVTINKDDPQSVQIATGETYIHTTYFQAL